jgi:DNA-binding CsgD family transcriptional regulator
MDKALRDLIDIIQFTEKIAAKIHGVHDEAEVFKIVTEEFVHTKDYISGIFVVIENGSALNLVETSLSPDILNSIETIVGMPVREFRIDLRKSNVLSQVAKKGVTLQADGMDILEDFLPKTLASKLMKLMEKGRQPAILTPLHRNGEIIGILVITAPKQAEYFIPSVRNLARHITTALELADEYVERERAEQLLQKHRDHLEKLVNERTSSLEEANTALRVMLKTADKMKMEMEETVLFNVKRFALPYLEELKKIPLNVTQKSYLDMLEKSLDQIIEPFLRSVSAQYLTLTPTEVTVTNLIKQGKTTKEIAAMLNMSIRTVETHRYNIRTKLGLKNSSINLSTYISSLDTTS